jgi:ankyrin repeat protein
MRKAALLNHLGVHPDSDIFLVGGLMQCAAAKGETQVMAKLVELGANPNRLDGTGSTPAHAAVFGCQVESLRWLLAHGADPSVRDRDGRTVAEYVTNHVPEPKQEQFLLLLKTTSNQQGGANGRQPFSSETNRTSAAAASRRSP